MNPLTAKQHEGMQLHVQRYVFTDNSTIGKLFIDGQFFSYTLEDVIRPNGEKVYGKTAIPEGNYEIIIDMSQRFGRSMPHILNVPNFEGIRIHSGNNAFQTSGCILLGKEKATDYVGKSKAAYMEFMPKLSEGLKFGKVFISIENVVS